MTMLSVDEVSVIFEGTARISWQPGRSRMLPPGSERPGFAERVVSSVWPDQATRYAIRLRIRLMQRTLVIFDGAATEMVLARGQIPRALQGAIVREHSADACALTVVPLTWLRSSDRQRGMEFLESATARFSGPAGYRGFRSMLVEDALIGSAQPLRFAYRHGPIGLDELRETINLLFRPASNADVVYPSGFNEQLPPDSDLRAA